MLCYAMLSKVGHVTEWLSNWPFLLNFLPRQLQADPWLNGDQTAAKASEWHLHQHHCTPGHALENIIKQCMLVECHNQIRRWNKHGNLYYYYDHYYYIVVLLYYYCIIVVVVVIITIYLLAPLSNNQASIDIEQFSEIFITLHYIGQRTVTISTWSKTLIQTLAQQFVD